MNTLFPLILALILVFIASINGWCFIVVALFCMTVIAKYLWRRK